MAPYDSDSSGDEDDAYTVTNVLLGYTTEEAKDDTISHLGGRPTWIDETSYPSAALAKCKVCNDFMVLLLQLNGELPQFPGHERRLYILSCRRKTCRRKEGSLRALRGVRISESARKENIKKEPEPKPVDEEPRKPAVNIGESLFGAKPTSASKSANPFSTTSASTNTNPFSTSSKPTNNIFAGLQTSELAAKPPQKPSSPPPDLPKTFASALSLGTSPTPVTPPSPPEPWPEDSALPPPYPVYYLDPDYEELDKIEDPPVPTQTMDLDEGTSSGGSQKEDKDVYESTIDKTFQKFADRLAQNPEQVLRYEFGGQPLLYSKKDGVGKALSKSEKEANVKVKTSGGSSSGSGMPRCGNCAAGRVFEVQLTPYAIMELERDEEGLDGMEWGTVIVGVCERDCAQKGTENQVGYLEEWVGVQWEELAERR